MMKGAVKSPLTVILLIVVTCGLYYYYWLYTATKEIKEFMGLEEFDPAKTIILTIVTCGIYSIFWYYKMSPIVFKDMPEKAGAAVESDKINLVFILSIFLQIVSCYFIQTKLNEIWEKA